MLYGRAVLRVPFRFFFFCFRAGPVREVPLVEKNTFSEKNCPEPGQGKPKRPEKHLGTLNKKMFFDFCSDGFRFFRFYWSNFHELISMEMMFRDQTMFNISFSYIKHHLDHMEPGFDHAIQYKMEF